jgi:hypothetical protein
MAKAKTPPEASIQPKSDTNTEDQSTESASHVCLEPIKHKGKRYQPSDPIDLTEAEAGPLIKQQAVAPA